MLIQLEWAMIDCFLYLDMFTCAVFKNQTCFRFDGSLQCRSAYFWRKQNPRKKFQKQVQKTKSKQIPTKQGDKNKDQKNKVQKTKSTNPKSTEKQSPKKDIQNNQKINIKNKINTNTIKKSIKVENPQKTTTTVLIRF